MCRTECNIRHMHELKLIQSDEEAAFCPHMRRLWPQHIANRRHYQGKGAEGVGWGLDEPAGSLQHDQEQQLAREREQAMKEAAGEEVGGAPEVAEVAEAARGRRDLGGVLALPLHGDVHGRRARDERLVRLLERLQPRG